MCMCPQLDHVHGVHVRCAYACTGRTIYIQRNSAVQLTSVGLTHARANKLTKDCIAASIDVQLPENRLLVLILRVQ